MDILIKNMEMPKNCRSCPLIYETSREFTCWQIMKKWPIKEAEHRQEGCPLVALPEHGDLIDEDEFRLVIYREIRNHKEDEPITMILKGILWEIDNAPVIVEANNG